MAERTPKPKAKPAAAAKDIPAGPILVEDTPAGPRLVTDAPIITDTLINPFPNGDKPPAGLSQGDPSNPPGATAPRRRRKVKAKAVTDTQLREVLTDVFQAPAIPYSMFHMDWAADHVVRTGADLADQLVAFSKTNEQLRRTLEKIAQSDSTLGSVLAGFGVMMAAANYAVPLLSYHGIVPRDAGQMFTKAPIPVAPTMVPTNPPPAGTPTAFSHST